MLEAAGHGRVQMVDLLMQSVIVVFRKPRERS
jgi:hypothetical protein